jgi:hypothetical protein
MGRLAHNLAAMYPGAGHEDEYVFSVRTHQNEKAPRILPR